MPNFGYRVFGQLPKVAQDAVQRAEKHHWRYEGSDWRGAYLTRRNKNGRWVAILVADSGKAQVSAN